MDRIKILKGPDRVRKRPAVIFTYGDVRGAENAVLPILELYATEAQLGYCQNLQVTQNGSEITISGDDRGIYLDGHNDNITWKEIFCELYAGPRSAPDSATYTFEYPDISHSTLLGESFTLPEAFLPKGIGYLDLCAAQYASAYMDVYSVRDGKKYSLHFRKGYNEGGLHSELTDKHHGTTFHFAMDPEVFTNTVISEQFFLNILTNFAILSPGLQCTYCNTRSKINSTFHFPKGPSDFVQQSVNYFPMPVYAYKSRATGRDRYDRPLYQAYLNIAIGFALDGGSEMCLHNFRRLQYGGLHLRKVRERICCAINDCFQTQISKHGPDLSYEELHEHIKVLVSTWCSPNRTLLENGTRQTICNQLIADMAFDATSTPFFDYVLDHQHELLPIIEMILSKRDTH